MAQSFQIYSIGCIHNQNGKAWIEVDAPYKNTIQGLDAFSDILVLYWLHENDTPEGRNVLQVHPQNNSTSLLTGIVATHSPRHPNRIALTRCQSLGVHDLRIDLKTIDASDNSPLIDIKSYIPSKRGGIDVKIVSWVAKKGKVQVLYPRSWAELCPL